MRSSIQKGATLHKEGCHFSVWAPHAKSVFVTGTFNKWDETAHPMNEEPNGWWSVEIVEAGHGDEYKYCIFNSASKYLRIDPYAQEAGHSDEYKYCMLNSDNKYLRIDPYAQRVTSSVGNSIITESHHTKEREQFNVPALNEMVIYELHIGTFGKQDRDPGPGNLQGVIGRLGYLKELGINAVEIMPFAEFAGGYSWGYNPSHIFAVESNYGAPLDFREFVDEAHRLGIAVIVDVVYNHFGPSDLDLWQFDGWSENDMGGNYFYNDWRASTPWGDTRPNYGCEEVRAYIRDNALMWFEEYGVDGLRWDMTSYIRNVHGRDNDPESDLPDGWSLMQWVNDEIREHNSSAFTIAEDLQGSLELTKATQDGGAGFQTQWAAPFVHAVRKALIGAEDASRDMKAVRDAIQHRYHLNASERIIYTESHDEVSNGKARIAEEVDPGKASSWAAKKKSTLGAVLVFTAPGIPMIFQGQEFLEDDWFHDDDPIDWTKKDRFAGILQLYKDLIALRLNGDGTTKGLTGQEVDVYHMDDDNKVVAYRRWDSEGPDDSVIVVANFSANTCEEYLVPFPNVGEWVAIFNSDGVCYDADFGDFGSSAVYAEVTDDDHFPAQAKVSVAPYSALILLHAS